eukprot:11696147-Karenia_brevis.AAC.1
MSGKTSEQKLLALFASRVPADWKLLGSFMVKARQAKRKQRTFFASLMAARVRKNFHAQKAAWQMKGRTVCRPVSYTHLRAHETLSDL